MPHENTEDTSNVGGAPSGSALLLVDPINDMAVDGAEALLERTVRTLPAVLALRDRADALALPVIYVNDHGQWREEPSRIVEHRLCDDGPGRRIVERIAPRPHDYFVVKPHLSGFYATSLPVSSPRLDVGRLIPAGVAADACGLFTAADAHMRDDDPWIPRDAVTSEADERTGWALEVARKSMKAETRGGDERSIADWRRAVDEQGAKAAS